MSHSYFVTATGTGVGKTVVTALIACALRARGVDAGVMKPFASGCRLENGILVCEDAEFLRQATGVEDEMELICPARWEEPLAPLVAARRAENASEPWPSRVREAYQELQERHECVIVEGVGGWAVPLCEDERGVYGVEDLAADLELPIVLVAARGLGTISHTLLSLRAVRSRCDLAALVFCDSEAVGDEDVAAQTSHKYLCESQKLALHHVPFAPNLGPQSVRELAAELDWSWL